MLPGAVSAGAVRVLTGMKVSGAVRMHHEPLCPALRAVGAIHVDAARAVGDAALALNTAMVYRRDGDRDGTVVGGVVTASQN